MVKLQLVHSKATTKANTDLGHRASATEGEAAKRLLESQGYIMKSKTGSERGQQLTWRCPFHEGPGAVENRKSPNFYLNAATSQYVCHSASCGERGNLQILERFFGVDTEDDTFVTELQSREQKLQLFERLLTPELRTPFYEHGLSDLTIERFRLGYEPAHEDTDDAGRTRRISGRYVIPYLEGRRPAAFRYYAPGGDPRYKYTWELGSEARLFNPNAAVGDDEGRTILCEGEQKAMLLTQLGYAACAVPGAAMWRSEWQAAFTHAKQILICFDNDSPEHHIYDRPDEDKWCQRCRGRGHTVCVGHNPGQEAATARVEAIGWRAKNIVLPMPPGVDVAKTDINDFLVRDGRSGAEFAELATGKRATPFKVSSLADIMAKPPEETKFLVDQGILPRGGRLLIAGSPKVGKSILADNLALSLAAGIPFLGRFPVDHPSRVLLLDRELSRWSLFSRMQELMDHRLGYKAAIDNLLIDHDHLIRLDQKDAYDTLASLIESNGAEVIILDTAYKFFSGDVESAASVSKAFEVLDKVIHTTGVSVVLTHHMRKRQAKDPTGAAAADPSQVVGSFLWTGWPNATILLNFLNRSVEDPFNALCSFTAFRDAAPPDPVALYRTRESLAYSAISDYSYDEDGGGTGRGSTPVIRPDTESVGQLLLQMCPTTEEDFLHVAQAHFGVKQDSIRPFLLDALSSGHFTKTTGRPAIIKFVHDREEQTWEAEHHLPATSLPATFLPATSGPSEFDQPMFDAAMELMPADF